MLFNSFLVSSIDVAVTNTGSADDIVTVKIDFTGTDFTVADGTVTGPGSWSGTASSGIVTFAGDSIAPAASATFVIPVTNPTTSGIATNPTVSTTDDGPTPGTSIGADISGSLPLTITGGTNDQIKLAVDGNPAVEYTIAAGTYDSTALVAAINTAISGSGATASWDTDHIVFTSDTTGSVSSVAVTPGTADATADIGFSAPTETSGTDQAVDVVATVTGTLTVIPGAATQVSVETAADGTGEVVPTQDILPGASITVYAITRDAEGNFIENVAADAWPLENITGGVVAGDLVPAVGSKSAVFTGALVGTAEIKAAVTGLISVNSGTLTVIPGSATQVSVETAADGTGTVVPVQDIASGASITVYAITRDAGGNFIENVAADAWSLEAITGGVVVGDLVPAGDSKSAAFTGALAGTAEIKAAVTGLISVNSGTLTVIPGSAVSIVISPDTATITAGESQAYTAEATDALGNTFDITADTVFTIDAGAGGSWVDNVYTSELAGDWTVTGTYGTLTDTAVLTVNPGAAETLTIVQQPNDTTVGVVIAPPVTVEAKDEFGNVIAGQSVAASLLVGTGTLSGTLTQTTNASGIATFDNLSINLACASQALRFTADSITVDSNTFTINVAAVYDKLLTLPDGWTLLSTDKWIDSESSAWEGTATLVLKYTAEGFLSATFADLKPVEALYVKMPGGGWAGLNYLDVAPGASAKALVPGWNLVSSATYDDAAAVFSPLRYVQVGEQEGHGIATLVSQGDYNLSGTSFYMSTLTDADWDNLALQTLDPFDGYWIYMNVAKAFGVVPD